MLDLNEIKEVNMKKNQFVILIVCVVAGLLFSLGMCMALIEEWELFELGIVTTAIGAIALLSLGTIGYINTAHNRKPINWKFVGKISYAVLSALVFGLGMAMVMAWNLIAWGLIVGVAGLIMLLFLIPMFFGFKE